MTQYSAIAESVQTMDNINHIRIHAKKLRFLNLHGNSIRAISNIDHCYYLEELDLSSNKVTSITGLEACESLLKLNLSCNQIRLASRLDFLYKLKVLNLSYNKLSHVKTLSHFAEKRFQLESLFLHGNKLTSVPATIGALKKILTLKHLTLHANPLCSNTNYRKVFGDCMPQLETIDDFPRSDDSFSESVTTESSVATRPIATPYIDRAVKSFKHELSVSSEDTDDSCVPVRQVRQKGKDSKQESDTDYTDLIKQVLTIIREEETPVKLNKDHSDDDVLEKRVDVNKEIDEKAQNLTVSYLQQDTSRDEAAIDIASLHSTNKLLLTELETERERRWKSEKHMAELSDRLVKNDHAIREYEELNKSSEAGINGIRDLLMKEQSQKMKLANLLETFKEKHKDVVKVLAQKGALVNECENEIQRMHKTIEGMKHSASDTLKQHKLSLQQVRQEAQVQRKQCELLRHELHDHQVQVRSLQELIVTREQDHVKEKENLVPLNGDIFNKRVNELVENEREKHTLMNKNLIDSTKAWQQKHMDLEKEFRIALYLENKRYEDLHGSYTKISQQLATYRSEVHRLKSEDSKKLSLIDKLKRSVAEQSLAIDKLRISRKELEDKNKVRISALEKELEESTKSVVELTAFQKENTTLKGEISAQQSVMEGLRAERSLWSKELAEQGAQLSMDRGRLQSEKERLNRLCAEQNDQLKSMTDSSRIKEHQLNDAMDTIGKLKETIVNTQKEHLEDITELETRAKRISEERDETEARVEAIRQALHGCQEEKEEIVDKYEEQIDECETIRKKYKELKQQWENKITVFDKVEKAAQNMASVHTEQMRRLQDTVAQERDKINILEGDIASLRERHLVELKDREAELHSEAEKASQDFGLKEKDYTDQTLKLEQEMRVIIHQSQQLKRENDAKLTKLAGALGEFTTLLQPK